MTVGQERSDQAHPLIRLLHCIVLLFFPLPRSLSSLYPTAPPDAIDLLSKLLQFNPEKRLTIEQAISHPYLAQFHNPAEEPVLSSPIAISIDDNKRLKISDYRKYLYRKIVERKKQLRKKREMAQAAAALAAGGAPPQPSSGQPGGSPSASAKPSRAPSASHATQHSRQGSAGSASQMQSAVSTPAPGQRSAAAPGRVASSASTASLPPPNNPNRPMQSSASASSVAKKR